MLELTAWFLLCTLLCFTVVYRQKTCKHSLTHGSLLQWESGQKTLQYSRVFVGFGFSSGGNTQVDMLSVRFRSKCCDACWIWTTFTALCSLETTWTGKTDEKASPDSRGRGNKRTGYWHRENTAIYNNMFHFSSIYVQVALKWVWRRHWSKRFAAFCCFMARLWRLTWHTRGKTERPTHLLRLKRSQSVLCNGFTCIWKSSMWL